MQTSPALAPAFRRFASSFGLLVVALGALVLAGWVAGVPALTSLFPGFIAVRPATALGLLLGGAAVVLRAPRRSPATARATARLLAGALALLAALTLAEYLLGRALPLDRLLAVPGATGEPHPGRMPFLVAVSLLLLGLALAVASGSGLQRGAQAQALALAGGLVPLLSLVSFFYGVEARDGGSALAQVAPQAAAGLALLTGGTLLSMPEAGPIRLLASDGPGGMVTRRLLVPVVMIPVMLGWLFLVGGPRLGQYEALAGAALVVVSAVVTGTVVVWRNAREVQQADDERARVEETLRDEREWLRRVEAERMVLLEREQAARAEAERASRAKDEFIATLSHELRTPLNSVLGWARLVRSGKLKGDGLRQAVEAIERGAITQAQIVDDLLDVSRIVRGALRLDVRPVDLGPVIDAAVDTVRPAAHARGIEIALAVVARGPVSGDAGRLQQVIWNLVANAIKFTPPGGRVEVRTAQIPEGIELVVEDNGNGIPREFLPHLFERFRQADSSTTREHGGLGLGLAIVRHLVEAHGGTVTARSPGPGQGSTFTVRLPLAAARARSRTGELPAVAAPPAAAELAPPLSLASVRVLVVDDDRDTREVVRHLLEATGAQVTAVGSVDEALAQFRKAAPDVLLSDIAMPGRDGYDLIRAVRALPPERGGSVPAAALTAFTQAEHRREALGAGYQAWLPKPVEPAALAEAVARLAGKG